MNSGNIVKYSASAGSGKTHVLAKEYLCRIFENPLKYRKILAVTFTNKAAGEMKHRILDELFKIAQGEETAIFSDLKERFPQYPDGKMQEMSKFILSSILSDYSRFSLTTIDSFFQKVFRSFAKEIGIPTNYGLYIEYNTLLRETITDIIREMKENDVLYDWLRNSIYSSYDDGKAVRLEETLYNLSKLVYSEQFKLLTDEEQSKLFDFDNIKRLKSELKKIRDTFEKSLKQKAVNALAILENNNVTSNDLYKGKNGLYGFLEKISEGKILKPSDTVQSTLSQSKFYSTKCNKRNVDAALKDGFDVAANSVVEQIETDMLMYVSAGIMQKNIDYVAVLGHVVKSLRERMANENNYVLADTGDLLRQIIGKDQTPFIYEKTGNEYDAFMIDEFQDTSIIQYHNFKSLLENSIAQGYDSLIVGDAKQSIYRWRNGDWSILNEKLPNDFSGRVDAHTLNTNWRSLPEIVKFNNSLFKILASIFDEKFPEKPNAFSDVYSDATQIYPDKKSGGYVRMEVVDIEDKTSNEIYGKVAEIIEQCQDAGYKASDICILVKKKDEATAIMKYLSAYSLLNNPDGKYNFDMLSAESLMVGSSSSVRFIVAVMLRVLDAQNLLNNCEMLSYYLSLKGETHDFDMSSLVETEQLYYPEGYEEFIQQLESKSLFEMVEEIISFFNLGKGDIAGLNFFQNQILDYMNTKGSDLEGFIEWWQDEGLSKGIVLSGEQDAISVMTIHKSKGLQFKIVIIPFINWRITIHKNTKIWVKTDVDPFNRVGAFPADCISNLKESLFANDYESEKWSTVLDSLNVLYVALTRAEDRLYGFLPNNTSDNSDRIDKYIVESFGNDGESGEHMAKLSDYFDKSTGVYEQGAPQSKTYKTTAEPSISFDYNVFTDKKRFVFRLNGASLLKPDDDKKNEKAYYGTVLHDILSRVKVLDDLHQAIVSAVADGLLPKEKSDEVEKMILNKIETANMMEWFDKDSTVLNEPDILVGKGVVRRPDRVIIKDDKVSILDYKFGEKRKKHLYQVEEYKNILKDMGYSINKACLWYVEQNEIVTV